MEMVSDIVEKSTIIHGTVAVDLYSQPKYLIAVLEFQFRLISVFQSCPPNCDGRSVFTFEHEPNAPVSTFPCLKRPGIVV